MKLHRSLLLALAFSLPAFAQTTPPAGTPSTGMAAIGTWYARDSQQPVDQAYTAKIKQYTTEPYFNSPLTDYLPASKTVPTPDKVFGDVSGAPNILPYAEDVYKYFRMLAAASPRVKVYTIGHTEEGREMIAVAIADESLLAQQKENDARLAKLGDPRTINMDDKVAAGLVKQSFPVYYITGTIHSPETGAPTALSELAYRLAVDDSPYIRYIRSHMIVLITPVVEVDGRDRMCDIYNWHRAHLGENYPHLIYWGHYVAHDNNRDAMGMTLDLTRNVLNTYLDWHAQVLHDLHESVPFLYDNTVGDGPYNAWIDPLLNGEWAELGWNNVSQMTAFGMPGVFTHGDFDTWSPGYLMFLAAMHNGISRLYETFGNGGADTEKRILQPDEYERTWYKSNPPLPVVEWSQRNNNNYEETALLSTISYFSQNTQHFLEDYYLKSKRSIEKPEAAGPAAYVIPDEHQSASRRAELLRVLTLQHVEISRLSAPATVTLPAEKRAGDAKSEDKTAASTSRTFPAGSYVIRMDQPYSRIADALLDRQYWSPEDPQKHPYDDTGWSFPDLFNVPTVRVTDASILKAQMDRVADPGAPSGSVSGSGNVVAVNNAGEITLLGLRYALKDAKVSVADAAFDAGGHHFGAGSLIIQNASADALASAVKDADVAAVALGSAPDVAMHDAPLPRIAMMHTWLDTQLEGWWREAFDKLHIPYDYINTQTAAQDADLRAKYDVIVFAPMERARPEQIIDGAPMYGNALPWQKTDLTPNLGRNDSTPDMRPGLGLDGLQHLKDFVAKGGLLITSESTSEFAIAEGMAPGVFVNRGEKVNVVGSVLGAQFVDAKSPVAAGFGDSLAVYSASGLAFTISNTVSPGRGTTAKEYQRPTGRGGPDEADIPEGRSYVAPEPLPSPKPWEATPLNEEQTRNNPYVIPAQDRPDVILRFTSSKGLLLSGLLEGGNSIEEKPIVVDAHYGTGNVLLFANNPIYRGETIGSYPLVFNAIMNWDHLNRPASN
ncbi:MAG TPA: M14 family zinc carboxypeptidase [Acidobacteriaceae bacterium]|nr:M14 family zinc carboxypeptidase [Acidobacteriaceae bacterium]